MSTTPLRLEKEKNSILTVKGKTIMHRFKQLIPSFVLALFLLASPLITSPLLAHATHALHGTTVSLHGRWANSGSSSGGDPGNGRN
jgi:hypothetical protein